jgi:8-oxo-dGTP pyrophosphatase MutT (NUDIX family)
LVSFPGGICDEGEFPIDAALRETWEELGIDRNQVDVLGTLTPLPDRVREYC